MPLQVINGVGKAGIRPTTTSSVSTVDTDAQAFLTAAVITDTTQVNAVNELVLDLKAAGIWTKMKALYPMVGGTATTHKWNLKDPRDVDAAYRLVFNGGGTHGPNGYQPNGTDAYADSKLTPSNILSLNSTHISYYSLTSAATSVDMGCQIVGASLYIYCRDANSYTYTRVNTWGSNTDTFVYNPDGKGLYISNRNSSTIQSSIKNNIITNSNITSVSRPNVPIYIGAINNPTIYYGNKECAFSSIGDGLTDLESNLFYQIVEKYQVALGRNINTTKSFYFNRNYSNETNAFIFNGSITGTTQISAVNTLVSDLKTTGLWTKMKAVYPMVGGTALSHKFNLANPVDTNEAFRLTFYGGGTHSSTGYQPNGTDAYADTNLTPSTSLSLNSTHISYYSRTNVSNNGYEMGCATLTTEAQYLLLICRYSSGIMYSTINTPQSRVSLTTGSNTISTGLFIGNRTASNVVSGFRDTTKTVSSSAASGTLPSHKVLIGGTSNYGTPGNFSTKECAFASIGDGLTDMESNLFYQIVEKFQNALGRNINTTQPFYYSSGYTNETNAFINNGGITDATQISAVNTLVTTLKTAGVWSKMKAVYPMVGGTVLSHKFNLVNPVDTDAAYRLVFNGGWVHSATGALPNGSNAYADTKLIPLNNIAIGSIHSSYYSRTNVERTSIEIGTWQGAGYHYTNLQLRNIGNISLATIQQTTGTYPYFTDTNSLGLYIGSRISSSINIYKNGSLRSTTTWGATGNSDISFYIGNTHGNTQYYSNRECAFASIGDGLTDAEVLAYYNAVQAFQTTLNRQV